MVRFFPKSATMRNVSLAGLNIMKIQTLDIKRAQNLLNWIAWYLISGSACLKISQATGNLVSYTGFLLGGFGFAELKDRLMFLCILKLIWLGNLGLDIELLNMTFRGSFQLMGLHTPLMYADA